MELKTDEAFITGADVDENLYKGTNKDKINPIQGLIYWSYFCRIL